MRFTGRRLAAPTGHVQAARPRPGVIRVAARTEVARRAEPLAGPRGPGPAAPGAPRAASGPDRRPEAAAQAPPEDEVRIDLAHIVVEIVGALKSRPRHQRGRDLEQEPARDGEAAAPPGRPPGGVRQEQAPLGAGDADVGEASLLLQLLLVVQRAAVREDALLHARDEDDGELEPLGGMERDECDGIRTCLVRILVRDQRRLLQEAIQGVVRRKVVVARRDGPQFEQVRPALLALLRSVGEHGPVAGLLDHGVEQLRQGQHPNPRPQPSHQRGEPAQGSPGTRPQGFDPALCGGVDRPPVRRRDFPLRHDRCGRGPKCLQALLADPARRNVEDPLEAHLVVVVAQDPQIRQRVLHFAALVEAGPADQLVTDVVAQEPLFDRAALGVRPVHDRHVAPLPRLRRLVSAAGQD